MKNLLRFSFGIMEQDKRRQGSHEKRSEREKSKGGEMLTKSSPVVISALNVITVLTGFFFFTK